MHSQSGVSVNITGRYLVVPVNTATGNPDTLRNYLVQTNSIIQEKLTEGVSNIPQVISMSKKIFSTEGRGDLFNRYFTHFELQLKIDLSK